MTMLSNKNGCDMSYKIINVKVNQLRFQFTVFYQRI